MRELLQESWTQISHVCWEGEPWLFKDNEKLGFQADGKRELIKNKQVQVCPFFFFFFKGYMYSANDACQLQAGDLGVWGRKEQGWFAVRSTSCAQPWPPTAAIHRRCGSTGTVMSQGDGGWKVSLDLSGGSACSLKRGICLSWGAGQLCLQQRDRCVLPILLLPNPLCWGPKGTCPAAAGMATRRRKEFRVCLPLRLFRT